MPTHAQQVRRRLDALGAEVTDTSPRGGLQLTAILPAGVRWFATGTHTLHLDYPAGARDAGFTEGLRMIKGGTFECTAEVCERCGRTGDPALPEFTFALSGKAMTVIQRGSLYQTPQRFRSETDEQYGAARRASAALQSAPRRQRGKGFQYAVTCDAEAAAVIAAYCQGVGEELAADANADLRLEGVALVTAADRIRDAVRAHTPANA